jgi:BirA family biotin operon repressor/biotin-[acetyl-CoA-carboxylase] ligase
MTPQPAPDQPRLPPAYRLVALDQVESTNDEARRLAEAGAEDGTLVWAREQTKGRGRLGRSFASPRGNLYLSLVLRPDCSPAQAAQLSFVAALGVGDGVGSVAPPMVEVRYKWPNDVLFNGCKGSGILLESQVTPGGALDWLILGIGVNVQSHPEDTAFPATNLRSEGAGADLDEKAMLEAFARHFLVWVNRWLEDGFGPVRKAWINHAKGINEQVEVRLPNETLTGTFKELDGTGALVLALPDGTSRKVTAGDVHFPAAGG